MRTSYQLPVEILTPPLYLKTDVVKNAMRAVFKYVVNFKYSKKYYCYYNSNNLLYKLLQYFRLLALCWLAQK